MDNPSTCVALRHHSHNASQLSPCFLMRQLYTEMELIYLVYKLPLLAAISYPRLPVSLFLINRCKLLYQLGSILEYKTYLRTPSIPADNEFNLSQYCNLGRGRLISHTPVESGRNVERKSSLLYKSRINSMQA